VADRHFMSDAELAAERAKAHEAMTPSAGHTVTDAHGLAARPGLTAGVVLAWIAVAVPLLWGVWMTLTKALPLFALGRR
jgi:hypothetical protein